MATITPLVTVETVTEALRAVRFVKPLGYDHPIAELFRLGGGLQIYQYVDIDVYSDVYVYNRLTKLLLARLNSRRQLHGLLSVSQYSLFEDAVRKLREGFQKSDIVLEAWTISYYQFCRSDLDTSRIKWPIYTNQSERTIQRRQKLGIDQFTQYLSRYEIRTRLKLGLMGTY